MSRQNRQVLVFVEDVFVGPRVFGDNCQKLGVIGGPVKLVVASEPKLTEFEVM